MSRAMKESGIPWIGEIPSHWLFYRIKYNTFLKGRIGWQGLNSNDFIDKGYCLITGTDFDNKGGINWATCYRISKERFDEDELLHVKEGDLLMTKDGTVGKMAYIKHLPEEASLNSHLLIIRQLSPIISNAFLYWVMISDVLKGFTGIYQTGTIMSSISQNTLGYFSCFCPSLEEQQAIADFLDKKCGEIDEIISLQDMIIEELKAYKQSVITEAVCRGLNPDAPMKDSGIEWAKSIPTHWKVVRLKSIATIVRGGSPRPIEEYISDTGYNWIKIGDTIKGDKYICSVRQKIKEEGLSKTRLVHCGDLILTNSMSFGEPYILKVDGCIHDGWVAFSEIHNADKEFLYYYFYSSLCKAQFDLQVAGGVVQNLNVDKIATTLITLPPVKEQQAIANYLDEKCKEIDTLISLKQSKIDALKEYKKSIIYEYITGKKEVNG